MVATVLPRTILETKSHTIKLYELNIEDIFKIISNDHLMVEPEEKIFDFIMGWINYDLDERSKHLSNLMNYLRLPLITIKKFEQICDEPLLNIEMKCLNDIMKKKFFVENDENIIKATIRTPRLYKPNIIFAIKGQSNGSDSSVMYMDLRREYDLNWKSCDYLFFCPPRKGATLVVSETGLLLLAVGGVDKSGQWSNCVDELDLTSTSKMWIPTNHLRKMRKWFSVSTRGKYIYIVGGLDPSHNGLALDTVEYYDPDSKVWFEIEESMFTERYNCSSIIHDSCLYLFGGNNDLYGRLSCINCYNLQENIWTGFNKPNQQLPKASSLTGITSKGNYLYLIGGQPFSISKCAYKINLKDLKWKRLPDMINGKLFANAVTIGNDLFVVGKNSSWGYENAKENPDGVFCELYITEKNTWQVVNSANILSDYDHIICLNDERLKTFNIDV